MFRLSFTIGFVIAVLLPTLRAETASSSEFVPLSDSEISKNVSNVKEDPAYPNEETRIGTKLREKQSLLLEKLRKDAAGLDATVVAPQLHSKVGSSSVEKILRGSSDEVESVQKSLDSSRGQQAFSNGSTGRVEESKVLDKEESSSESSNERSSKMVGNPWIHPSDEEQSEFSYLNPEDWSLDYPECAGHRQSPINLNFNQIIRIRNPSDFLFWTGYWNYPDSLTITNNGHSVEMSGSWATEAHPFISGGPLEDDYLFGQLHFHWGPKDSVGSEHRFNNRSLSMELHMLHYKREYGNATIAQQYDDGIAVYSVLYEIGTSNPALSFMADGLTNIQDASNPTTSIIPFPLAFFFPPTPNYITYSGSLTTPPCSEVVTWLISDTPGTISRKQMELFRKISSNWLVNRNYRPLQAANNRDIWGVTG